MDQFNDKLADLETTASLPLSNNHLRFGTALVGSLVDSLGTDMMERALNLNVQFREFTDCPMSLRGNNVWHGKFFGGGVKGKPNSHIPMFPLEWFKHHLLVDNLKHPMF